MCGYRFEELPLLAFLPQLLSHKYRHMTVMNGASDLFIDVLGEAGRHTRMAVGVSALPYDVAVEVEGTFEVR